MNNFTPNKIDILIRYITPKTVSLLIAHYPSRFITTLYL